MRRRWVQGSGQRWRNALLSCILGLGAAQAALAETAFKINGKTVSTADLVEQEKDRFFRLEKEKHQLIEELAREAYLEAHFAEVGKKEKLTGDQARAKYILENTKINDAEITATLAQYADHPRLKELPPLEQREQVSNLLRVRSEQALMQTIVDDAEKAGKLVVSYPAPKEPVYDVVVTPEDFVRYRHEDVDASKPVACRGDQCQITIVEYSEYQCPFCSRVIPTAQRVLQEYRGKVRWAVRSFPLNFHDRATPAAIAANCAGFQSVDKFWGMYAALFENQQALSDADFVKYAERTKVDMAAWKKCVAEPAKARALVEEQTRLGTKKGVTGTPAFFINGRRLSGALPFEEFKRVIDDELKKSA